MITISAYWKGRWQIKRRVDEQSPFYTCNSKNFLVHDAITDAYNVANYLLKLDWCEGVKITQNGKVLSLTMKEEV